MSKSRKKKTEEFDWVGIWIGFRSDLEVVRKRSTIPLSGIEPRLST